MCQGWSVQVHQSFPQSVSSKTNYQPTSPPPRSLLPPNLLPLESHGTVVSDVQELDLSQRMSIPSTQERARVE